MMDVRAMDLTQKRQKLYLVLLFAAGLLYAVLVPAHWSQAYIDLGDGNYLYISWRTSQGLVLYRDIMAPQPPLHLVTGNILVRFAQLTGLPELYMFRGFSYLLHLVNFLIIYLLGLRLFRRVDAAVLSAIIYLFIPIGFWWSLGYQSEPTEILFLLLTIYFFLGEKPWSLVLAAIVSTHAVFTNMTAAPYVAFIALYAVVRRRSVWYYYVVPLIALTALAAAVAELLTGAYLDNVIFNQVGTFPHKEIGGETAIQYALRKIPAEARDVFVREGVLIVLGVLGLWAYLRHGEHRHKECIAWFAFFSWCSIIFVAKGGTMDYIFTLGEPYVALFAGFFIAWFFDRVKRVSPYSTATQKKYRHDSTPVVRFIVMVLFIVLLVWMPAEFISATLKQHTFEMPARDVKKVTYYIEKYTEPGDTILSPPYFAFLTHRKLIEEYSELYIWYIKYLNERVLEKTPGEGVRKVESITAAIEDHRLPLIILNTRVTGRIPEIKKAIDEYYKPAIEKPFQTLNTTLELYIPKKLSQNPTP